MQFSRFHINLGSNQKIQPANLIGVINDTQRLRGAQIGRIEILRNFSFFEIDSTHAPEVEKAFQGMEYHGLPIIVTAANERPSFSKSEGPSFQGRRPDADFKGQPDWKSRGKHASDKPRFNKDNKNKEGGFKRKPKSKRYD